jgi:hypothetical protein
MLEYFLGSLITSLSMLFAYRIVESYKAKNKTIKLVISQSRTNEFIKKILMPDNSFPPATSQSMKHFDSVHLRILIVDNKAYWITNNAVFAADVINGQVEKETTAEVDTMGMDNVQLKQMMFIVEKLKEGL